MEVMVSAPCRWAHVIRRWAYSCVMPGTVPGAGRRMMSAPASTKEAMSCSVIMFSAASERIPAACILPAARTMLSPTASLKRRSVCSMAVLVTPTPGLPVSRTKSMPSFLARRAFSTVARRPADMAHMGSVSISASSATGSRLMPMGRPVSFFSRRMVSPGSTGGRPWMTGCCTSNRFSSRISAPMEAANSALVTLPSSGCTEPMVSQAMTRPSLFWMDSSRSALVNCAKSEAQQSSIRFAIVGSPFLFFFYYTTGQGAFTRQTKKPPDYYRMARLVGDERIELPQVESESTALPLCKSPIFCFVLRGEPLNVCYYTENARLCQAVF